MQLKTLGKDLDENQTLKETLLDPGSLDYKSLQEMGVQCQIVLMVEIYSIQNKLSTDARL